jgi:parvulin-like peptidyl-prolyl isomerase
MMQKAFFKLAPWLGLAGAAALITTLFMGAENPLNEPAHALVVTVSRDQMHRSLDAMIAENPGLKNERERLMAEMKEGAAAQSLLVAEAFSQGIAESDYIVRNRLAELQVMALHERAETGVTSEAIEQYYTDHGSRYLSSPRRRVLQIFVPVTNRVSPDEARRRLDTLFKKETPSPDSAGWTTEDQLRSAWGPTLARQIFSLPVSEWSEPIRSTKGWHRINVIAESPRMPYSFDEVRTRVSEDLRRHLKQKVYSAEIERLKNKYPIEWID